MKCWIGRVGLSIAVLGLLVVGCSDHGTIKQAGEDGDRDAASEADAARGAGRGVDSGADPFMNSKWMPPALEDAAIVEPDDSDDACGSVTAETALKPVHLAFAVDVSGSMGQGDKPWHDRTLKWEPVVTAIRGLFEDDVSQGIFASLTFFPADPATSAKCEDASYTTPVVPMTPLPSDLFADALATIGVGEWRAGTPTLYVMNGVRSFVESQAAATPGEYAIVLVTDGYPEGCDDITFDDVVAAVIAARQTAPVYVIGIDNPPIDGAPRTVQDLNELAVVGGTEQAFIIDTGDPTQTTEDVAAVIDEIRGASLPCEAPIPEAPDGRVFDKEKVRVTRSDGQSDHELTYRADCDGPDAWHYDDPHAPTEIVLCPSTCEAVQAEREAQLHFEFGCTKVIEIPD